MKFGRQHGQLARNDKTQRFHPDILQISYLAKYSLWRSPVGAVATRAPPKRSHRNWCQKRDFPLLPRISPWNVLVHSLQTCPRLFPVSLVPLSASRARWGTTRWVPRESLCEYARLLTLLQRRFLQAPGDSLSCPVCKNVLCDPVTVRQYVPVLDIHDRSQIPLLSPSRRSAPMAMSSVHLALQIPNLVLSTPVPRQSTHLPIVKPILPSALKSIVS